MFRSGALATGPFEVGAFVCADPAATRPDVQLYLGAITMALSKDVNHPVPMQDVEREPGISVYGQMINLASEGMLRIKSADPDAPLSIAPNWLTTDYDCRVAVAMIRYMRRYMRQPALAAYVGEELLPGNQCESDADILDAVRRLSLCGIHAVGSCRMGNDRDSVVDERLRVRGVEGLRVADCSVMPSLVSGNTNGPAMVLGWRAADLILADTRGHSTN
jgi:choline dehydrogenase-like flavoprotein